MKVEPLYKIATVITGKTPSTSNKDYYGGDYLFITPSELHGDYVVTGSEKTLTHEGMEAIRNNTISGTTVLVGCIGWDMGNVALCKDHCATNQQINAVTKISPEVNPLYLYYWLKTKKEYLFSIASVTRTPILSKSVFEQIEIPIPAKEEQDQIARTLELLDVAIRVNNQINDNLQALMSTLYDYWFVQFDFPDKNDRPYKSSGGKMVWNEELKREIPEGWEAKQLKSILRKNTDPINLSSVQPTIDLSVMPTGSLSLSNLNTSEEFTTNLMKMNEGDLLFGGIRPYLKKAGIAPCNGAVTGTVKSFSPINPSDYNIGLFTLVSESMFGFAMQVSTGTRMPTVTADALLERWIPYNSEIARRFNEYNVKDTVIANVQENIQLQALRDWLLPMLMNGQATVRQQGTNYRLSDC